MKAIVSILIIAMSSQGVMAQHNPVQKEVNFRDPITNELTKIETGDKVAVWFKKPIVRRTGTITNLSESSMIIRISKELQFVPISNIQSISIVPPSRKRFMVEVKFASGEKRTGELIRRKDSLGVLVSHEHFVLLKGSEIKFIRIRGKGFTGKAIGIGAVAGVSIGALIGAGNYESPNPAYNELDKFASGFHGAVVGGVTGLIAGALIGLISKKYEIGGDQYRFDQFAMAYQNYALKGK